MRRYKKGIEILYEYPHNDLITDNMLAYDRPRLVNRKTSEIGG